MDYLKRILHILNYPLMKKKKDGFTKGWQYKASRRVVCGLEIALTVPLDSSYGDALKCLPALVASCGREIELLNYKGTVVIRIIEKDWVHPLRFNPKHLFKNKLLIGYDRLLQPVYHPLNVHILEGGASGAGKTDWQRWIAYQLLLQGYEVYICDMKGYSFDPFEGLVKIADNLKSSAIILRSLVYELEKRKEIIKSKVHGTREQTIATFKPIVILIDEAADLSPVQYARDSDEKQLATLCDYCIGYIGRKGREPKVFCIYGTQRPDMKTINKQFKDNVEAAIAFRTKDHYASQIIIDRPGAELISPDTPGRCIYSHGGKDILLQVPYIGGDAEWEKLLYPIKKRMGIHGDISKRLVEERKHTANSNKSTDSHNPTNSNVVPFEQLTAKKGQDRKSVV